MPASGPVYQPTTVSYEQQNEWSRPGSYLSQTVPTRLRSPRCILWFLLALALFSLGAGLIIVIEGNVAFSDNLQNQMEDANGFVKERENSSSRLGLSIVGSVMILIGVILLVIYTRMMMRRKECPCYPSKEERMAMHLDQGGNGQIHTMNPSTDLLVAAQYGPVSEIAYQPPSGIEHEETSKLMATTENKEGNEENERMLESDPRIVLRPLSHNEEV
ncbi:uncharacterized protein LOC106666237 isoform X1 [Cimex lectularius]|uniref:Uncharacterized protein n=1 Tax=Cimex lectularius TaxID=79782 RepID=A0A8I6RP03_CIMLE|nr:uncharacterized protein LOC106666237 isoform X1 [Cimex lectularius]